LQFLNPRLAVGNDLGFIWKQWCLGNNVGKVKVVWSFVALAVIPPSGAALDPLDPLATELQALRDQNPAVIVHFACVGIDPSEQILFLLPESINRFHSLDHVKLEEPDLTAILFDISV